MITADVTFVVNRPVEEVFTLLSDFENNLKWRASQSRGGEDLRRPDLGLGRPSGLLKIAEPLLAPILKRRLEAYADHAKRLLEEGSV